MASASGAAYSLFDQNTSNTLADFNERVHVFCLRACVHGCASAEESIIDMVLIQNGSTLNKTSTRTRVSALLTAVNCSFACGCQTGE